MVNQVVALIKNISSVISRQQLHDIHIDHSFPIMRALLKLTRHQLITCNNVQRHFNLYIVVHQLLCEILQANLIKPIVDT